MSETTEILKPQTIDEIRNIIAGHQTILPIGNRTKPGCSLISANAAATAIRPAVVSLSQCSGIIEYQPSEFTFTALAGTRVAEIASVLKERNQYLPFDPLLVDAGATIGGTIASNAAGPGRFRYGGVRDFLLAVRLIDGNGASIFGGAKVVKNSAGFDIPKLMVGSLGRLGVLTELTFKVFPMQQNQTTIQVTCHSHEEAIDRMSFAARSQWELDSIDYRTVEKTVCLKVMGPERSNRLIAREIIDLWDGDAAIISTQDGERYWTSVRELEFASPDAVIVKIPTATTSFLELTRAFANNPAVEMHSSVAGSLTWLAIKSRESVAEVHETLRQLSLAGLVFRTPAETTWLGMRQPRAIDDAIKQAMDPANKFPGL